MEFLLKGEVTMEFQRDSVGRKITMGITGILMILFVIAHMLGNLTIFASFINAYAVHLHALPPLLWLYRVIMFAAIILHIVFGIQLTLENRAAKPQRNASVKYRSATAAGLTMIWTGLLLLAFIVYHLLHFTVRVTNPGISHFVDTLGRPDVYRMVVLSFQRGIIAFVYALAMAFLLLHLNHGIQSFVQTFGWNDDRTLPRVRRTGVVISVILFLGFVAIPFTVVVGILRG
jgi:succinate dehydrogenase / fumarate reductase, cytochrome b subunit